MLSLEEQIERLADAAFDETVAVRWTPPTFESATPARPTGHRRVWMTVAAATILVSMVAGLVLVARDGERGPVAPVDTSTGTVETSTTVPADEVVSDSSLPTTSILDLDQSPFDRVSPYGAAVEQAVGYPVEALVTGLRRTEQETVFACVNGSGWIMTDADLDWIRTDTLDQDFYPSDATAASTALFNDERRQRVERSTLRGDAGFDEVLSGCTSAIGDPATDLGRAVLHLQELPSFGVGDDPAYLAAEADFERCLDGLDLTKASLEAEYEALSMAVIEASTNLDGGPALSTDQISALEVLDRQERDLSDRIFQCTDPLARTETQLAYERQDKFLAENPDFIDDVVLDDVSLAAVRDSMQAIATADDRVELTATDPVLELSVSISVPSALGDWQFEAFGNDLDATEANPRVQPVADPDFFLLPTGTPDPNGIPRMAVTPVPGATPDELDSLAAQDTRPQRTGETERILSETAIDGARLIIRESTVVNASSGRTLPALLGYLSTAEGQVFAISATGIGIETAIEIAATVRVR